MRHSLLITVSLLLAATAQAECEQPSTTGDLYDAVEKAQKAFIDLEFETFAEATTAAETALPCVQEPIQRHLAAELHRIFGLRGAINRDPVVTTQAFAAARSLEPNYTFPVEMVPEGSPVLTDYKTIDLATGEFTAMAQPRMGRLEFDGRPSLRRPNSWPTLAQYVDVSGKILWTNYLTPSDEFPFYAGSLAAAGDGTPSGTGDGQPIVIDPPGLDIEPNMPLAAAAGGAIVIAGGMFLGASMNRGRFDDPSTPEADLEGIRKSTNSLVVASALSGGVALGLGAAVVFTW